MHEHLQRKPRPISNWRLRFVMLVFACLFLGLLGRLLYLTVIHQGFLREQGNARSVRILSVPAYRGMILDRNGQPLAISTPVFAVWVNPQELPTDQQKLDSLTSLLQYPADNLKKLMSDKQKEFVYLKRGITPEVADEIKNLAISGVHVQREFHRFYPQGAVSAHILGFTNIDDRGQEGIELGQEQWLQGVPGKTLVTKDRIGRIIATQQEIQAPKPGHDLVLSIDQRIQYLAFRELSQSVISQHSTSGSVVVLDAKSGEILAMASYPSYNPNQRNKDRVDGYRNRTVTDVFEPGSVMKPFSVATVLEEGHYTPDTKIETSPGYFGVGRNSVRDIHDYGLCTVTQVLEHSSNVGVAKMILNARPEHLREVLAQVGFGQRTPVSFPGEGSGVLPNRPKWAPFTLATLAFGYGVSVTPLQLAQAYTVFANKGQLVPVSLVHQNTESQKRPVFSEKVADQTLMMLKAVVEEGTGNLAKVPGYTVGGKTGTARLLGQNGYEAHHHIASFVGIVPITEPKFIIAVIINDPSDGTHYGGSSAAPVFAKIAAGGLRILDIPPDNLVVSDEQKDKDNHD